MIRSEKSRVPTAEKRARGRKGSVSDASIEISSGRRNLTEPREEKQLRCEGRDDEAAVDDGGREKELEALDEV